MPAVTKANGGGKVSQLEKMAKWMDADPDKILGVLNATAFNQGKDQPALSVEELQAAIMVANEYKLNPLLNQIHVIRNRGKLLCIVGIDGWLKIIHSHGDLVSIDHESEHDENGKLVSTTCRIVRRREVGGEMIDQSFMATEYLEECKRQTEPWKQYPARMLRHKATIQCARYAYGLTGIVDEDEAERVIDVEQKPVPRLDINPAPVEKPEPVEQGAG